MDKRIYGKVIICRWVGCRVCCFHRELILGGSKVNNNDDDAQLLSSIPFQSGNQSSLQSSVISFSDATRDIDIYPMVPHRGGLDVGFRSNSASFGRHTWPP